MVNLNNEKQNENLKKLVEELPSAIESFNDSLIYTKKIIVTAISNILFVRNVFEENCYTLRAFEGLVIRLIDPRAKHKSVSILSKWIEGSFEALDKKYLKCISLSFFEQLEKPEHVLETYDFDIKYTETDAKVTLTSNESSSVINECKSNARNLIRTILCITNGLNDLPSRVCINMRLFYYEDVTPLDYEPSGFRNDDFEHYKFENGERIQFDSGSLNVKWVQMKLNINASKSMIRSDCESFISANETFSKDDTLQVENYDPKAKKKNFKAKLNKTIDDTNAITNKISELHVSKEKTAPVSEDSLPNTTYLSSDQSMFESDTSLSPIIIEKQVSCGCGLKDTDELSLIQCEVCNNWQHAVCYSILIDDENALGKLNHCCHSCHLKSKGTVNNAQADKLVYEDCIMKRVLIWLSSQEKFVMKSNLIQAFNLKENTFERVYLTLENQSILKLANSKNKNKFQLDKNALSLLIDKLFIKRLSQKENRNGSKETNKTRRDENINVKRAKRSSRSREPIVVDLV